MGSPLPHGFCEQLAPWSLYGQYYLIAMMVIAFPTLFFVAAPYGRFGKRLSFTIPAKVGWVFMELPAPVLMVWYLIRGGFTHLSAMEHDAPSQWLRYALATGVISDATHPHGSAGDVLLARLQQYFTLLRWVGITMACCYILHYCYRTFVFPCWIRSNNPMDGIPVLFAFTFSIANATLQAHSAFCSYDDDVQPGGDVSSTIQHVLTAAVELPTAQAWWLYLAGAVGIPLVAGLAIFLLALGGTMTSDWILTGLRSSPDDRKYYIPTGFLFDYVSCPNYLCEIIEWTSYWWLSGGRHGALIFVLATMSNLIPRALAYHGNYKDRFGAAYPSNRYAIVPGLL